MRPFLCEVIMFTTRNGYLKRLTDALTSQDPDTARLQVDVGQTGFWEGREFRFDYEISAPIVFKFSSPIDFILQSQTLLSHDGAATLTVWTPDQGTPSGVFGDAVNTLPNNAMSDTPPYTQQVSIASGGTFTPTDADPNLAKEYIKVTAATSTAQRNTVGGSGVSERGLPAGDYYLSFTGIDASYRLVFEERP